MSIRTRIAFVAFVAVASVAILLAGVSVWAEVQDLRGQVDIDLRERASLIADDLADSGEVSAIAPPPFGVPIAYAQVVTQDGGVISLAPDTPRLPVDQQTIDVAAGVGEAFYSAAAIGDVHIRMLTTPLRPGAALQVARPVDEAELHFVHFGVIMALVALAGVALAVVLGRLVARSALRPVERLTLAAERVAATRDLAHRIEVNGDTELDRLAMSMNSMVAALDEAIDAQNQLVADASHELQTPLTVLRTNLELLQRVPDLSEEERGRIHSDMQHETDNLSRMVSGLVDLARTPTEPSQRQWVELADCVDDVVDSISTRYPDVDFVTEVESYLVLADPDRLEQMVRHLVENAAIWTPPGSPVTVVLEEDTLVITDHGPGIDPEDMPRVFHRFYRAPSARALPGAGLGLAIVEKASLEHGWSLRVGNAPGGGTLVRVGFVPATDADMRPRVESSGIE